MHPRTRNPGNGYRSNPMGLGGIATASRISPESSMRGHGGNNSYYRSYNRGGGFVRGQSRQFHRPQPSPQKSGDVFIEAGRLATAFLVSKGLLPADVLSGKWKNDSLKNQVGAQEGDGVHTFEGRASARLRGPVADIGPGNRRYPNEYNSIGSRSFAGGRIRNGSLKDNGSELSREFGRSGSLSERSRAVADAEGDSDAFSRRPDEQQDSNEGDSVSQNSRPELAPESSVGETESALEKQKSMDDAGAKASSSSNSKDNSMDIDVEPPEKADVIEISHVEAGEIKDDEMELQDNTKNDPTVVAGPEQETIASENSGDLLKLCSFARVPTRPRSSSLTIRRSKVDTDPMLVDENTHDSEPPQESRSNVEDSTVDSLSGGDSSRYPRVSKILESNSLKEEATEDGLAITYDLGQGKDGIPVSFLDKSSVKKEANELSAFEMSNAAMDRVEKRALDEDFTSKASKKPRESTSSGDARSEGCLDVLDSLVKIQTPEAPMTSEVKAVILPSDEKRLLDMSLYCKADIGPCMEYAEEKELFPGSFKTCDLNLMESSDVNENHKNDPILIFPSIPASRTQGVPVEIDLTMSNHSRVSNKYGKDIEVIDLENDLVQEDKDFNNLERRTENVFPGLDGYSSNAHDANVIPDAQDGYGLMFSELLGNDITNCSSVPPDMNPLHNDMGLHNGEGILGDDESIYMSLGEIPLCLLRGWDQPSQDYGKPF